MAEDLLEPICRVVHEALRAWSASGGGAPLPAWDEAEEWMVDSTRQSVLHVINTPDAKPSDQHDQWMAQKIAQGWVYGEVKDAEAKTHPMLVPYDALPEFEKRKDILLMAAVNALTSDLSIVKE